MNPLFDLVRRARLRAMLFRHVKNAGEIWRAHRHGEQLPPFVFRNGTTLLHGPGDGPLFLFFEIVGNACYRRRLHRRPRGTIVDVGANIGLFTLDCAVRYPRTPIEAYEPNPVAYETLRRNVEANGLGSRVRTYNEALGRTAGPMLLWSGQGSVIATAHPHPHEAAAAASECRMVGLDTVLERIGGAVGLLKIDAEGSEADILEGGASLVSAVEEIVCEYHEDRVLGALARCRSVLEQAGFSITVECTRRCGPLLHAWRAG